MSNVVIQVENLSKQYQLGTIGSGTLYRDVQSWCSRFRGKEDPNSKIGQWDASQMSEDNSFWALKDVSFKINQGDIVGIIGRNGAGKSTLLKILSRVTGPTSGQIKIKGRIASLLEVGTGFHPELTGRENVYLNGAILGMRRTEIDRKFDEIVEFSEIAKFIDTPVKRYSSGMYVRLAFAVAAHLESEILIVDEVLAVGDLSFQKKCLGKMQDVGKHGRTVLFVSHNIQALRQLCYAGILLNEGKFLLQADINSVINKYIDYNPQAKSKKHIMQIINQLPYDSSFRLHDIRLKQYGKEVFMDVVNSEPLEVEIVYSVLKKESGLRVYIDLCDRDSDIIFRSFHDEDNDGIPTMLPDKYISKVSIPANFLGGNCYYELCVRATIYNVRSCTEDGIRIPIQVQNTGIYNRAYLGDKIRGKIGLALKWETSRL